MLICDSLESAGKIYGNTLNNLVDVGDEPPREPAALNETGLRPDWADPRTEPYIFSPYPDYNSEEWRENNQGTYRECTGPRNFVPDAVVFRGKSEAFNNPTMGSYNVLQMDSMLCFERETWLGPYATKKKTHNEHVVDWENIDWKALQDNCYKNNADRFERLKKRHDQVIRRDGSEKRPRGVPSLPAPAEAAESEVVETETGLQKRGFPFLNKGPPPKSRTALILRAYSGKKYTENDKQNIRALITELALRSGGEYEVFLLLQIKDGRPLTKESAHADLPKEFWDLAVVWNDEQMAELYPLIPADVNKVHVSQWFSVQKFALDHPKFDYYWNWELDSRFTGHHYDLLEKLVAFADKQPRKGMWERNERYYIPSVHGDYDTTFRTSIEQAYGNDIVWGPAKLDGVTPVGPKPPVSNPKHDNYKWGVGEETDYISLGPMFNPVNASWVDLNAVWGYAGYEGTPRRATIGTQSRCSRKLLLAMHEETRKGNHIGSEMTPQSVALLHGLKAVFAPIPMFFDRAWSGESLNKWFNPGPKGESGSTMMTAYGWGLESRFEGSTWYYRTTLPMKLYNNFLGWEDSGIGGEKVWIFPGDWIPVLTTT